MNNPEKLATLGTQHTVRRQNKKQQTNKPPLYTITHK